VHHLTDRTVQLAAGFNPFNGVSPSFGPFQSLLTSKVGMFLSLVYALCFVYAVYHLMIGVARLSRAKKGGYGDDLDDVKTDVVKAAAAIIGLTALPVIYGILVSS